MAPDRVVLIISDLHMGVDPLDDFDCEIENHFVSFLDEWRRHAGVVELIINGDLLDFVQARPFTGAALEAEAADGIPLCFTENQSLGKLAEIAAQHGAAFDAMARFLAAGKQLTVLPGNHDADFYWENVRAAFAARVCGVNPSAAQCLHIHLDPVYRPPGHEHLWVEHGHQHDPVNAFILEDRGAFWSEQRPPIFLARSGERRLYECIGTRFLIKHLNYLDGEYPFIDNVKPFGRFLRLFGASALVPGYGPLKAAVAVAAMIRYLASTAIFRTSDLLEDVPDALKVRDQELERAVRSALPAELAAFTEALARAGFTSTRSARIIVEDPASARALSDFVAEHLDVLDALGADVPQGVLALGKAFRVDETDDLRQAAERVLDDRSNGCRFVTMGHTHDKVDGNHYFNTGSWTRYYQYADDEPLRPWTMLRTGSYERFPYALEFVQSEAGPPPSVGMKTFASRQHD